MSTILSTHFKNRRLELSLRPGAVARRIGYRSIVGAANKICRFEETGTIQAELLVKLAAVLGIDRPTIECLIEDDRRANFEEWTRWASVAIRPHLIIKLIPGIFGTNEIPDALVGDQNEMVRFAADLARRAQKRVWLVLSRRLSIVFDEQGNRIRVEEASPGQPNGPYMRLKGSRRSFLFDEGFRPQLISPPDISKTNGEEP